MVVGVILSADRSELMNIKSLLILFIALVLVTAAKASTSTAAAQTADGKFTEREVTFAGASSARQDFRVVKEDAVTLTPVLSKYVPRLDRADHISLR